MNINAHKCKYKHYHNESERKAVSKFHLGWSSELEIQMSCSQRHKQPRRPVSQLHRIRCNLTFSGGESDTVLTHRFENTYLSWKNTRSQLRQRPAASATTALAASGQLRQQPTATAASASPSAPATLSTSKAMCQQCRRRATSSQQLHQTPAAPAASSVTVISSTDSRKPASPVVPVVLAEPAESNSSSSNSSSSPRSVSSQLRQLSSAMLQKHHRQLPAVPTWRRQQRERASVLAACISGSQ